MSYIIDRFEENIAVLETDNGMIDVDIKLLPSGAKEGSVLIKGNNKFVIDQDRTEHRRSEIRKIKNDLWK